MNLVCIDEVVDAPGGPRGSRYDVVFGGGGSFTEFIRTPDRGQVSINISKPGITKGNHWHNTNNISVDGEHTKWHVSE